MVLRGVELKVNLVAEWIHLILLGIIPPTIKLKVYTNLGLVNSATKSKGLDILALTALGFSEDEVRSL